MITITFENPESIGDLNVDIKEIIEKIKDIISLKITNKKVFDKDVADALCISQMNFATMKNRNSIPYKEILLFSLKHKIDTNWLFFGVKTSYGEVLK